MQLSAGALPFVEKEGWRVLHALEKGMLEYEYIPKAYLAKLAHLRVPGIQKVLSGLLKDELVVYEKRAGHQGYRLTWTGFDYLAVNALVKAGLIDRVGPRIGVGKEADVHIVSRGADKFCLKIHRLGRTSFRSAKAKRGYLKPGQDKINWLHMSSLSAEREFTYLKDLKAQDIKTPTPIEHNRHVVLMTMADGLLLNRIKALDESVVHALAENLLQILGDMLRNGLVHGDYNEFNLIVDIRRIKEGSRRCQVGATVIDFPQVVRVDHPHAREFYMRDADSIKTFFWKRFRYEIPAEDFPDYDVIVTPALVAEAVAASHPNDKTVLKHLLGGDDDESTEESASEGGADDESDTEEESAEFDAAKAVDAFTGDEEEEEDAGIGSSVQ